VAGKHVVNDSNGSVHLFQKVAAVTWVLTVGSDAHMAAFFLLTDFNLVTLYRSKLEGYFRALKTLNRGRLSYAL